MNETIVWKAFVTYLLANDWTIHCTCPPGATSYTYPCCSFKVDGMGLDAPDVVASKSGILLLGECKPSFSALLKLNRSGESDIDKLTRMRGNFAEGRYDKIFKNDYNVDVKEIKNVILAVSYSAPRKDLRRNATHFVVHPNLSVEEYHEANAS